MEAQELRQRFLDFFAARGHKIVPSASLIPTDPSVLLTTAGMQPFKDYYLHPAAAEKDFGGGNIASVQKCFRTSDIDEVGDDSHLTFFEMLGNFSFGGYTKKMAIAYAYEFITQELNLSIAYVTIFKGSDIAPKDEESRAVWQELGITDVREEGMEDVFWGPTGRAGPCGPTTEIYCLNAAGRAVEIWNLVFNQFFFNGTREELLSGTSGKKLEPLSTLGVYTGMGLERLAMIVQKKKSIFETDLFQKLFANPALTELSIHDQRIFADHARAISFLIADGVRPSNKGAGYVLRRLLRRLLSRNKPELFKIALDWVKSEYRTIYPELASADVFNLVAAEQKQFGAALDLGLKELAKLKKIDTVAAFQLYETYGLPFEVIKDHAPDLSQIEFEKEFERHQEISRGGLEKKFAGGLVDREPATIRLHTAHHLLLAALQQLFGKQLKQRGSNINQERLRLDFTFERRLTAEEIKEVEKIVNEKITENLPVAKKDLSRAEAEKLGAEMEFGQKYGETVSVYSIEDEKGKPFSLEFCGGPHVARTGELGRFKIIKDETVAAGLRRIKAILE